MKFAIVSMGRTGSTLLVNLLTSHPDIECQGELFGPGNKYDKSGCSDRRRFLETLAYESAKPVKGFKMPWPWIQKYPGIFDDLKALDYKIIRLTRAEKLAMCVSGKLSVLNNDFSSRKEYHVNHITVDPLEYIFYLGSYATAERAMNNIITDFIRKLVTSSFLIQKFKLGCLISCKWRSAI